MWENDICLCASTECPLYSKCYRGSGVKAAGIYTSSCFYDKDKEMCDYYIPIIEDEVSMNKEDKILKHSDLCSRIHSTYVAKNSAYGDSFGISYDKYGIISALTRMSDKWNRLENLILNNVDNQVADERLEDTLLDLANYCLMTVMELEKGDD